MNDRDFERVARECAPQVLGVLVRRYRDFAASEDALQEALLAAAAQWPRDGVPENPRAWLTQVASRRVTDEVRSNSARRIRETAIAFEAGYAMPPAEPPDDMAAEDDTLVLMYMCCHPALTTPSAIALTLRAVAGLTTAQIAHAFLVPESTMGQRISRAKQTIKESGVPFRMPPVDGRAGRLDAVLHVLYLIFNEGYAASSGDQLTRPDLAAEAIRLARIVYAREAGNPEVGGLLALMLLTEARRAARTGPEGEAIPMDQQDRSLWDRALISEGVTLVSSALRQGAAGPYQLQAAIAAVHDEARTAAETDWPQILALYDLLDRLSENPMVRLNRVVAAAMVHGPRHGLVLLEGLGGDARLRDHHRLFAVQAHLLEMAGDLPEAITNYRAAAARTASLPERNYLLSQAARLAQQ
ncbi:MAG: DUF6596 domain-containing protein [Bryobacteraceae bacterium]